jgi:hypothetical protein
VQVSSDLVLCSSRIKFGKKGANFERSSVYRDLPMDKVWSHRIMSNLTCTISDLQFEFSETSY